MDHKNIDSRLEKALKQDFEFTLPEDFTDSVLFRVNVSPQKSDKSLYWLLLGAGLFMALTCLVTILIYTEIEVFKYIAEYGGWGLFTLSLIAIIQFLDKKLVKEKLGISSI